MGSPSKAKGSSAERDLVNYLRTSGWPHAERRLAGANKDRGDIAGIIGVCLEVKNCTRTDLAAWVDEVETERRNDNCDHGAVWHKRRGKGSPADWFVTMTGAQYVALLQQAGYGHPPGTDPA